jgi:hypothetical protein
MAYLYGLYISAKNNIYKTIIVLCEIIPDDGGSTHLWNVGRQSFYTAVHPRKQFWI